MKNPSSRNVLVTGAAGFIGSHLCESLLRNGDSVVGIDNFDPFYPRKIKHSNVECIRKTANEADARFEFIEMDVRGLPTSSDKALSQGSFDSVFHLAAKAGVRPSIQDPLAYVEANVTGTVRLLEYCQQRKIPKVINVSSSSVYGDTTPVPFSEKERDLQPVSPYAASKRSAEVFADLYARLYGLRIVTLRLFTVYGPRQRPDLAIHRFTSQILAGETITLFGDGSSSRDYTFVGDIIQGLRRGENWLEKQAPGTHDIFNIGGSRPVSLLEMVQTLETVLGTKAKRGFAPAQTGDVLRTFADISKAKGAFGYQPETSLTEGLRKFVDWRKNTS